MDPNQTWQEETTVRHKGNPQENLGPIACVAPHAAFRDFFVCLYCASLHQP